MKALKVEIALRKAISEQKDFSNSADYFKYLADTFVKKEKREEFLEELEKIFRNYKVK